MCVCVCVCATKKLNKGKKYAKYIKNISISMQKKSKNIYF